MKLVEYPHPSLRNKVDDFNFETLDACKIEKNMIEIMQRKNGVGLSANQVDLNARIFVMRTFQIQKPPFAVINPEIIELSKKTESQLEGCLSFPNVYIMVKRPVHMTAKYFDISGKERIIQLEDYDARIFLHEYDHLNGVNFIDGSGKLKLRMAMKRKKKLENRKTYG